MVRFATILMSLVFAICGIGAGTGDVDGEAARGVRVPIVMYHSIYEYKNNNYVLSPKILENDLKYFKNKGYTPVFISELVDYVNYMDCKLPAKPIVITFDDGNYNNYSKVLPLIKKYNFKCVVSVVGKFIEVEDGQSVRNNEYSSLNYKEIINMHDSGLVEFGNHTYDWHKIKGARKGVQKMRGESDEHYKAEIVSDSEKCRKLIKNKCGIDMQIFTYPYGFYSLQTKPILQELGYKAILTCTEGINRIEKGNTKNLYNLKRYNRPPKYSTEQFFSKIMPL